MFCYCAEARRVARLLTARYDAALAPAGMTAAQFELLGTLRQMGMCGGRELARTMAVDTTTLSRNLKVLIEAGWVRGRRNAEDARQQDYTLTAEGSARLTAALPLWKREHASSGERMGKHAAGAERALRRMADRLR